MLDEVQWADDEERGAAWTQLLLAGEYRHVRLLGALDALPLVRRAFPDAELRVHERKLPLEFVGARQLRGLTPGTVVVAFSRKAVLALAGEVNRIRPGRVAVLYGAMPLASRREEIDRFLHGGADVCVATDVLGHGVNLPVRDPALRRDEEVRRRAAPRPPALGARPDRRTGRAVRARRARPRRRPRRGRLGAMPTPSSSSRRSRPTSSCRKGTRLPRGRRGAHRARLGDLGVEDPRDLDAALAAWHRVATREWAHESWLAVESLQPIRGRLASSSGTSAGAEGDWGSRTCGSSPTRRSTPTAPRSSACSPSRSPATALSVTAPVPARAGRLRDSTLEEAEEAGRVASMLRWFALQYPGVGGVTIERAAELERAAAERVVRRLAVEVRDGKVGRCRSCGQSCPPWFPLCDRCARSGRR